MTTLPARVSGRPRIERRRHYGQYVAAGVLVVAALFLAKSLATNPRMQWPIMWHYLWNTHVVSGLVVTLVMTVVCQTAGTALGCQLAVMRLSRNRVLQATSGLYIWFFRGTPLLVQLIFWYNLAALFPTLGAGIPFTGIGFSVATNTLISGLVAGFLGFTLNEAAYMAEIVRSGISAVDPGQREAALSAGMTETRCMRRIVLPQAMRVIVPPTANQAINLLKATSLVAFISGGDLLTNIQDIYANNFAVIPLLVTASVWYLIVVSVASVGQRYLERHVGRGFTTFNDAPEQARDKREAAG
ncbi:amino acid ABC transporter permease [Spirillospora sp. CA-142024]|uniref:amino acid ABC transporter permease n=1 Tax=Spirillospora sp. CA-142024 TaxID=3240036 RepID=UPI003D8CFCE6